VASVSFHRSLYAPEAVEAAAKAYAALATITLEVHDHEVLARIENVDERVPDVVDAFCNHALFESIVRVNAEAAR
jgi:hypothetical protein